MTEQEKSFEQDYETLLKKYKVYLELETFTDEWGIHAQICFVDNGFRYYPVHHHFDKGYRGMGR